MFKVKYGMELRHAAVVFPWDTADEHPDGLAEVDAGAVLHNWTAAWRPEILAQTRSVPIASSPRRLPEPSEGGLVLAPPAAMGGRWQRWKSSIPVDPELPAPYVIDGLADRAEIIARLHQAGLALTDTGNRWAAEFFALGYAYLQVDLLTGALVEPTVVAAEDLRAAVVTAAQAALAGDDSTVQAKLRRAYDLLEQIREHAYPMRTYLLDLVLLGPTVAHESLEQELQDTSPKTYLPTASFASHLQATAPALARTLGGRSLAATPEHGADLSLATPLQLTRRLGEALDAPTRLSERPPVAYVQTHAGVPPQLLDELAARRLPLVLAPFGGRLPEIDATRLSLSGWSGESTPVVAARPRASSLASTLLLHAGRMSEGLSLHDVSVEVFAAYAGRRCPLFEDLRRVAARSTVLGKLVTLDAFFNQTQDATPATWLAESEYGPLALPGGGPAPAGDHYQVELHRCAAVLAGKTPDEQPAANGDGAAQRLAALLGLASTHAESRLVLNKHSYARPVLGDGPATDGWADLAAAPYVQAVPALGYRVTGPATADSLVQAADNAIFNEHLHALVDQASGGLQALRQRGQRPNRVSQRLAVRRGEQLIDLPVRIDAQAPRRVDSPADRTLIETQATLTDLKGGVVGVLRQVAALFTDWDRLVLDIFLDTTGATTTLDELSVCCRFALPDEPYRTYRGVQSRRLAVTAPRFVVTDYAQLVGEQRSVTIASATAHTCVRFAGRMLDVVLPTPKGGAARTRLIVALDERHPHRVAQDLAAQRQPTAGCAAGDHDGLAGWVAHVDAANVQVIQMTPAAGDARAMDVTLCETDGSPVTGVLRFAQPASGAHWRDASDRRGSPVRVVEGAAEFTLAAHECRGMRVTW